MVSLWVAIVLLLVVGSFCALRLYKRVNLIEEKFAQQAIALHHDLMVINEAAMGVGKRLINTEKKLTASIEKQQHLATDSAEYLPFNQAIALAEKGADAMQLVDSCGLSEAEAELVTLLQCSSAEAEQ